MYIRLNIIFFFLISASFLFFATSCGTESPSPEDIKPSDIEETSERSDDKITIDSNQPLQPITDESKPEPDYEPPEREVLIQNFLMTFRAKTILYGVMCYRDAYGFFPESVEDILEQGWFLFWHNNVHTNQPLQILDRPPDTDNQQDLGNVYYEKIDNDNARFHFIVLNARDSRKDNVVWENIDSEITYDELQSFLNPDDRRYDKFRKLQYAPKEERIAYYYAKFKQRELENFFHTATQILGTYDDSFIELLRNMGNLLSPSGLEFLSQAVEKNWLTFDIGTTGNDTLNYFNFTMTENEIESCWELLPEVGLLGRVDMKVQCPNDRSQDISLLNSKNLDKISIPADLIINRDDIHQVNHNG